MDSSNNEHIFCLSLGSNINPEINLPLAIKCLVLKFEFISISNAWETPPIGADGPNFVNASILMKTKFAYQVVKAQIIHQIETELGRERTADKYAARTIDLDIVIFKGEIIEPKLWDMAFLTVPTAEILPDLIHTNTGETLHQASDRLKKTTTIIKREDVFTAQIYL